jgi:hypothetical protein
MSHIKRQGLFSRLVRLGEVAVMGPIPFLPHVKWDIGGDDKDNRTHKQMMYVDCFTLLTVPLAGAVHLHNYRQILTSYALLKRLLSTAGYLRRIPA